MTKYVFAPSFWDITVNELAGIIALTRLTIDETMLGSLPRNFHRHWQPVAEEQVDQNEVSESQGAEAAGLGETPDSTVAPTDS